MSNRPIRLVAGSNKANDTRLRAGIEIKMQPGWKTYWRYPGDSGVPPHFDFSGSENLKDAKVLYPAPHLFTDETGQSLGYKGDVILPVSVAPENAGKPVRLRMKIDYAVCEKLCVPAEGRAELSLGGDSSHEPALAAAEARVPKQVTAAQLGLTAHRVTKGSKPMVAVDIGAARRKNDRGIRRRTDTTMGPAHSQACNIVAPRGERNSASNLMDCRQASIRKARSI